MEEAFYIYSNEQQCGPYPVSEILKYINEGLILQNDFIYDPPKKNWIAINQSKIILSKEKDNLKELSLKKNTYDNISFEYLKTCFNGQLNKIKISFFYQCGLVFITIAMILIPLIYLSLIISIIILTYYYSILNFDFISTGHAYFKIRLLKLFLYITPIISSIILLFFMIKPFFAKKHFDSEKFKIKSNDQKLFFNFINLICAKIGTPMPDEIYIDCNINASAKLTFSFEKLFMKN